MAQCLQFQEWAICRIKDKEKDPKKINKIIRQSVVMAPQLPVEQNQLPLDHHDQLSHDRHYNWVDVPMPSLPLQYNNVSIKFARKTQLMYCESMNLYRVCLNGMY